MATNTTATIYHHTDHLTGAAVDTDQGGYLLQVQDYLPFGTNRLDQRFQSYDNNKKFTGKELDTESGLYYYGARYYDSDIGKWMGVDPENIEALSSKDIYNPQELNSYSYVLNNPLKYIDPNGKWVSVAVRIIVIGIGVLGDLFSDIPQAGDNATNQKKEALLNGGPGLMLSAIAQRGKNLLKPLAAQAVKQVAKLADDITKPVSEVVEEAAAKLITEEGKGIRSYDTVKWDHITSNHFESSTKSKSTFYTNSQGIVSDYIDDTIQTGSYKLENGDFVFEKKLDNVIGFDKYGNDSKTIRVIRGTDEHGNSFIKSAYPIEDK